MKKNIMPFLLTVCMAASSMPVTAMAGDDNSTAYEKNQEDESAGEEGGTISDVEGENGLTNPANGVENGEEDGGDKGTAKTSLEDQIKDGEITVKNIADLEAAVAALNADEGDNEVTVYIPAGTYNVTGNEKLAIRRANVTLKGEGDATIIDCGAYSNSGQGGIIVDADNVTIEDLKVITSGDKNVSAIKVTALEAIEDEMRLVENTVIKNVTVSSENGHGINLHGTKDAVVDGLTVEKAGKAGISLANSVNVTVKNTTANYPDCAWGSIGMMFPEEVNDENRNMYTNPVSLVYGERNDINYIYADERNAEGFEGVNSIDFEAAYTGTMEGDIRKVSVADGVDVPESFKYAASVGDSYYTTINGAIEAADDGATVVCAPGTYDENIVFGDKSITLKGAQAGVKPDGEKRADDSEETILTGTISTANGGTTASDFNEDQKIVIDGFKFEGDGLKVGDCSYSTVGSLTVKNCIMTFGENSEDTIEGYGNNKYNYFVKISSVSPEAEVTVEDNYVTGNPPTLDRTNYIYPMQLWGVKDVTVKENKILLGSESAARMIDAVNISVLNENAVIDVSENEIANAHNGVLVSTWKLNGTYDNPENKFTGKVSINDNKFSGISGEMMYIGAINDGNNDFAGSVTASGNIDQAGEIAEPNIVFTQGEEDPETAVVKVIYDDSEEVYTVQIGDDFKLPKEPSKNGYTFEGWRGSNGKLYDAKEEVTIKEDMTFKAEWEK